MIKNKTLLFCYYNLNLGDDLFIKLTINYLGQNNVDLLVPDGTDEYYYQNYSTRTYSKFARRIDRVAYNLIGKAPCLSKIAREYEKVAVVGGSMFIQNEGWESSLRMYQMLAQAASKFLIIGSNFGPYSDKEFLESYKKLFAKAELVTFRDNFSKRVAGGENSYVYPDMIFNQKSLVEHANLEKILGVSVIDLEGRNYSDAIKQEYIRKIVEICERFQAEGYKIRLFSFCESQGDTRACETIKSQLTDATIHRYTGSIEDFLVAFEECKYMIASRFHAMILGWDFGIPTLPIIYSNKALNVINDLQQEIRFFKVDNINANIDTTDFSTLNNLQKIKNVAKGHLRVMKNNESIEK